MELELGREPETDQESVLTRDARSVGRPWLEPVLSAAEAMETVLMVTSASAWVRSKVPEVAVG